jgi:hypothetical protein
MPRFYFDIRAGQLLIEDRDGSDLGTFDEAEQEAVQITASTGRDRLPLRRTSEVCVDVRDERRTRVLTVTLTLGIKRLPTEPDRRPRPRD